MSSSPLGFGVSAAEVIRHHVHRKCLNQIPSASQAESAEHTTLERDVQDM